MKKLIFVLAFFCAMSSIVTIHAQTKRAPTFSKTEKAQIKQLLKGSEYAPVFSNKGELAIATKKSIKNVKPLRTGGFSKVNPSVANNILVHSGYVLATSKELLNSMKSKLGKERFQQLETILLDNDARQTSKAIGFKASEKVRINQLLKGSGYAPVFSNKGELAIATKKSIKNVKPLRAGGFSKVNPSVANNVLVHSGYVLATSKELLNSMKSKLGKERFQQLETMLYKNTMTQITNVAIFNAKERVLITNLLQNSNYSPVFAANGKLAIIPSRSISSIKPLQNGGFSSANASASQRDLVLQKSYVLNKAALSSMKSNLGKERFQQLEAIIKKKGF